MKNLPVILLFTLFLPLFKAHSDEVFASKEFGLELHYPSSMQKVPTDDKRVLLLLSTNGALPTFNITIQPGKYVIPATEQHVDLIIESYKQVGIQSVRHITSSPGRIDGGVLEHPVIDLEFTSGSQQMRSSVAYLTYPDYHLVLTFLSLASQWEQAAPLRDNIFRSLKLQGHLAPQEEAQKSILPATIIIFCGIAIVATFALLRKLRR